MALFSCFKCFKPVEQEEVIELDLSHCSLKDVPSEIFNYERTLEVLNLESNDIRDLPRQVFHCHELKRLNLSDNELHVLPPAVSSLSQLRVLDVSKNVLSNIPETIKQCRLLEVLDASVNPLQKVPESFTQLLSITELYLNDTFLEFLPANFGRLTKLRILELRENLLNTLPKTLSRLKSLERLDIGQNEFSELPEVIGSLTNLKELWIDGNRIKQIPSLIGQLTDLVHFEASVNHIDYVSDEIQACSKIQELALSTNELVGLPEAIGGLESLVTLKLDDNRIEELPMSVGKLKNLEELIVGQNFLERLPPSIGLCRKLHTLNVDDNDLESLPREIGSCTGLRILSAHGNRLTTLPAELDHISNLAVVNLTANMIQYLPVSLTKLTKLTALWLSENQHKPLVQLNQETDPETGQRVLTNYMLPQIQTQIDYVQDAGHSDTGSFHASSWEEEYAKRSHIKWAGDQSDKEPTDASTSNLRREPTPFPKEMRAMAKRAQKLREHNQALEQQPPTAEVQLRKKSKEHRPRMQKKSSSSLETDSEINRENVTDNGFVVIREAKVTQTTSRQTNSENGLLPSSSVNDSNFTNGEDPFSYHEIMPHENGHHNAPSTLNRHSVTTLGGDSRVSDEHSELEQFEAMEKSLSTEEHRNTGVSSSPEKSSRDSGVISPSEAESLVSSERPDFGTRFSKPSNPSDSQSNQSHTMAGTNLHSQDLRARNFPQPPPYHIAAAMSKHASSFANDTDTVSESEASTAPSSLMTVLRGPSTQPHASEVETDTSLASTPTPDQEGVSTSKLSRSRFEELAKQSDKTSCESDVESIVNHAQNLRKVSEQLLGNPRSRQSYTGIPSSVTKIPTSRPSSRMSQGESPFGSIAGRDLRPSSYAGPQNTVGLPSSLNTSLIDSRIPKLNGNFGTPQASKSSSGEHHIDNGLLTTIEKAAFSDEESPPPLPTKNDNSLRKSSLPISASPLTSTRIPKMSFPGRPSASPTVGVPARPSLDSLYENLSVSGTPTLRVGSNISTSSYVSSPKTSLTPQSKIPPSPTVANSKIPTRKIS